MNTVHEMTIGEPFNPRYEACGFHPEETVSRRRDLTDGQKRLYDRMVRWARAHGGGRPNERAGEVWRSHENMAAELGKSERQVRRNLARLESLALIRHRIRDGRKSNTYEFLFHRWFEETAMSSQIPPEGEPGRSPASAQTHRTAPKCPVAAGHPRPVKPDLSGPPRPANQRAFNQKEESSSSSSQDNGRLKEQRAQSEPEKTTKKAPFELERQSPRAKQWWTPEDLGKAAVIIGEFTGPYSSLGAVDVGTVLAIMPKMESILDLRLWLASSKGILKTSKSWGRYVVDAKHWPFRRVATLEQLQRTLRVTPACAHEFRPADRCPECADEREQARRAAQEAAAAARARRTPEEILEEKRCHAISKRWEEFLKWQDPEALETLRKMSQNGELGQTLDQIEASITALESGKHEIFEQPIGGKIAYRGAA